MNNIDIIKKIDNALLTVAMPDEVKKLLLELRDDIPNALTYHQKQEIYVRWVKLIMNGAHMVYELSQNI